MRYHTESQDGSHTLYLVYEDGKLFPVAGSTVSARSAISDFIHWQGKRYLTRIGHMDDLQELLDGLPA